MMRGQNIICIAKEWSEDPTANNHVMRLLARENRVLWLNSIGTRTPDFASRRDLTKVVAKLRSFTRGPTRIMEGLTVYSPIVLPFPHSPLAVAANRRILERTFSWLRHRLGFADFQLWTFLPNAVEYVGRFGESLAVYYCTDEWSEFAHVDGVRMAAMERSLLGKVDVAFTTSSALWERKREWNPETHLAPHGVDQRHFARALDPATDLPPELVGRPRPVLGFFGLVEAWIDVELLAFLARSRPDWTVAVVGKSNVSLSELAALRNVVLPGRRPYEELPRWCKGFDVALCPFRVNELTRNVNPMKLREYLSAGLPVVATDLPEIRKYGSWCAIAHGAAEFLAACERTIAEDSPARRRARSEAMKSETWEARVADVGDHVMRVLDRKRTGHFGNGTALER
jgi:glycosyltransferase involved in cell wall biosynthesis